MDVLVRALRARGVADVRGDATLAELTTLRVGGRALALAMVQDDAELAAVLDVARERRVPLVVVGRGSNLLVPDAGWPGIALVLGRGFRGVEVDAATGTVVAGAAEPMPALAVAVADAGLAGFAWGVGVPGTVGGAVRMNAGAHGHDLAEHLVDVDVVRPGAPGRIRIAVDELGLGYRHSRLPPGSVVVAVRLSFPPVDATVARRELELVRAWRREHQPINEPNCGSVFTNPDGRSAGELIDAAGLKGTRVGGAEVSSLHANFIVTRPGATASDVEGLIRLVRDRVREHAGVELSTEVVRLDPDVVTRDDVG